MKKVKGDKRIPDKTKTRLFGADREPLELRTDKENVYFDDSLKDLAYFPEWKEEGGRVRTTGGITKKEAVAQIGGWAIAIIERTPLAPEKGQGKTMEKDVKIKGQEKRIKRKQVEGGLNVAKQSELLKQQNEEGLTPEEWLFLAALYLKEENSVLDNDRKTNYYCRLLGAKTISGGVPCACWSRDDRQALLGWFVPDLRNVDCGLRSGVRVGKA